MRSCRASRYGAWRQNDSINERVLLNSEEPSADLSVSRILKRVSEGKPRAAEELLLLVYEELRRHFFSAAAEAMRRLLIEHVRSRDGLKRGELHREPLAEIAMSPSVDLTEINTAHEEFEEFEREMPDKAELVKLRYFRGSR